MIREELLQTAKPILFNTEMIRAILDERKTATRRVIKKIACAASRDCECVCWDHGKVGRLCDSDCVWLDIQKPPYQPGDMLYVRERFCYGHIACGEEPDGREAWYIEQTTNAEDIIPYEYCISHNIGIDEVIWKPSIHMPKEASRIFLKVTNVRVERLHDMSREDAIKEGVPERLKNLAKESGYYRVWDEMERIWNSTIKKQDLDKYGWGANPWVFVIEFERIIPE